MVLFPLYFICISLRSVKEASLVSAAGPVLSLLFIILFFPLIKSNKYLKQVLIFINIYNLWVLLTAMWSLYPAVSFSRGIIQIIISNGLILGGFYFGSRCLKYLLPLNLLLIATGIFSLTTHIPADYWGGWGYGLKSFWGHQNNLGSLLAFTFPAVLYKFKTSQQPKNIHAMTITYILIFLNIVLLILTHSRTSIAVLVLAFLLWVVFSLNKKLIPAYISIIVLAAALFFILSPLNKGVQDYIHKKEGTLLERKMPVIMGSFEAAKDGKLIGLGFGVSNPRVILDPRYFWHYEGTRMVREKSVSFLAIIEETGIAGLFFFLLFISMVFYILLRNKENRKDSVFIIALLFAMIVHAQFESWLVGVASPQLSIFFGLIGTGISLRKETEK